MKFECSVSKTGLVVVKRNWSKYSLITEKSFIFSGIEGDFWPDLDLENSDIDAPMLECVYNFEEVKQYYENILKLSECNVDLLFFKLPTLMMIPKIIKDRFKFIGYDYGYFYSMWNYYSIVLNEILFGKFNELRNFKSSVNKYNLFENQILLREIIEIRDKLYTKHTNEFEVFLEPEEIPYIVEIWQYIR